MRRLARTLVVFSVLLALPACSGSDDADLQNVEQELADRYLRPLSAAGLRLRVEDTCRLQLQPADPTWHLRAFFVIDAPVGKVAEALSDAGIRMNSDRTPIVVQQEPGDPQSGWNGRLAEQVVDRSEMTLTYDNVRIDDLAGSGGWGEPCPL